VLGKPLENMDKNSAQRGTWGESNEDLFPKNDEILAQRVAC